MFRFLKILFGKGIDAPPEVMCAMFVEWMYPEGNLLTKIAELQTRQNNKVDPEAIVFAACGCSEVALTAAGKGYIEALGGFDNCLASYPRCDVAF